MTELAMHRYTQIYTNLITVRLCRKLKEESVFEIGRNCRTIDLKNAGYEIIEGSELL